MVICTTCGQDNPAHLVFCQMCGQRLGPRVVPPTPPIGIVPNISPSAGTVNAPRAPTPAPAPAPAPPHAPTPTQLESFAKTVMDPAPPPMETSEAHEAVCPVCATPNPARLRYCQSCGTALKPGTTKAAPAPPAAPLPNTPPPVPISAPAPAPIQPARVVDLGAPAPAPETMRACARCRAKSEATALFCRYCGASLAEAPAVARDPPVAEPPPTARAPDPEMPPSAPPPAPAAGALLTPAAAVPAVPPRPQAAPAPAQAAAHAGARPTPAGGAPPSLRVAPASARAPASAPPLPRAATAASHGRLVIIAKDGGEGPAYPLHEQVDLGRTEGNIVIADDRYLSPRHARLTRKGGALLLRDLGSVNGVFLRLAPPRTNGAKPAESEVTLRDQDLFLVGQQVIRFEVVRDAEEGLGPAVEHGTLLFGTPTSPRFARLCQRTIEGVTRDVYYVSKRETVLGRESGDIVFTEDPFLSRRHAVIRADGLPAPGKRAGDDPRFALVDLGSSNGTFIQIRSEVSLHDGDQFRIGQQLFRVDLTHDSGTA